MCSDIVNGKYTITAATVDRTVELVKMLMKKYNIAADHVIRHYDVTGKSCPEPWVRDESRWTEFKKRLTATSQPAVKEEEEVTQEQFNKMMDTYLASLAKQQPQAWSKEARDWAEGSGLIKGDEHGNKQYESYCSREQMVQFLYRFKDIVK